jgi:hypothetical protein
VRFSGIEPAFRGYYAADQIPEGVNVAAPIVGIILGVIELFFGRRLFWLFVGIAGFLIGYFLAPAIFHNMSGLLRILIGIGIGIVFAILAIFFTRFMVAVAGFFIFGPAAVVLIRDIGANAPNGSTWYWVAFAVGGILGFILLWAFFDWALIVLTSLAGAGGIVQGIRNLTSLSSTWQIILFVILAVIGIVFQARSHSRHRLARGPMRRWR